MWHSRRLLALILGFFVINGALLASVLQQSKIQEVLASLASKEFDSIVHEEQRLSWMSSARSLVEDTHAAIREAGGEPGAALSPPQRKSWELAHPCASREELLPLWEAKGVSHRSVDQAPSRLLTALFEAYGNLHGTCTHGGDMEYVTNLYRSGDVSTSCRFLVVEFGPYGIGNRMLWLASAYLYALLTQRVLLIDTRSTVHSLLCEPFPGSSWQLPEDFPYSSEDRWTMPADFQKAWDNWEYGRFDNGKGKGGPEKTNGGLRDFSANDIEKESREMKALILSKIAWNKVGDSGAVDEKEDWKVIGEERKLLEDDLRGVPSFHRVQANDGWSPNPRFFCDKEQQRLHLTKWVSLSWGCLYFLPDLFAIPSTRPVLEELFPNRDPLTHLLRQLTLPVDSVWEKVRLLYTTEFKAASKVVGIQVRYRDGGVMYRSLNDLVNERISKCAQDEGLVPEPSSLDANAHGAGGGPLVIFIASLYPGLRNHLEKIYAEALKNSTGLKLVQLSNFGLQSFDLEGDHQALTEIICLSLSHELMTSPQSTYGQVAQAYGGLTPWLIEFKQTESRNCVRGQSTDACYQLPIAKFTCPFNKEVDGKPMVGVAPYLKPCQDTDGLQLVPPWTPSVFSSSNSSRM